MSQVVACMYAVMQMIQNTSIIIAESTFYLCMEVSSFIFSQMQKKIPQISCQIALEQTSRPYFFATMFIQLKLECKKKYYVCPI